MTALLTVALLLLQTAPQAAPPAPNSPVIVILACADNTHSEQSSEGALLCQSVDEEGKPLPPLIAPAAVPLAVVPASVPTTAIASSQVELVYSVDPVYPTTAALRSIEGSCTLSLTVDANGLPQNVRIAKSLSPEIDPVALAAVRQYRFKAAQRNGHPIATQVAIQLAFHVASR